MFNYGLRNSLFLFKKLQPFVLSYSFKITNKTCSNLSGIQINGFIKRDMCQTGNKIKTRTEKDEIDNEKLQQLLEDPEKNKAYKLLQYEIEYMREMNEDVPREIRPKHWIYLLHTFSKAHTKKYIRFLFLNEVKRDNALDKKKLKTEAQRLKLQEFQKTCPSGLEYGLGYNSLFLRLYDTSLDSFLNYNLAVNSMFEPKIVFDCGYNTVMRNYEILNCAKQILISFVFNRIHKTPAQLYCCNAPPENEIMESLHNLVPSVYDDTYPFNITSQSYLDMFDRKQLVYLTPHCRTLMTHYDPDKIYIIGAMVDKVNPQPFSLAKAKRENIHMEKLPIDRYLNWGTGSNKSLTINQVLGILLDVKYTKDWMTAFLNHIPTRKLIKEKKRIKDKIIL